MPIDESDIPPEYRGVGGDTPTEPRNEALPRTNRVRGPTTAHFCGTRLGPSQEPPATDADQPTTPTPREE
jgi:hypothetical protein